MDILLIVLIIIIPLIASIYCRSSFSKYNAIKSNTDLCGQEIARKILDEHGLSNVYIVETRGNLSDHYDPKQKVVRLSKEVFNGTSVASLAVAAHECGHAIQDKEGYSLLKIRSLLYPIARISSSLAYYVILFGFLLQILDLIYIGIAFVFIGLLFQLVTLPVEFNASKRALSEIKPIVKDVTGYDVMLKSAAYTYVAGVLASALQLLRLIGLTRRD